MQSACQLSDAEVSEKIFEASSLETAVAWRRIMAFRIASKIAAVSYDDPYYSSKVGSLLVTKTCVDAAIHRLLSAMTNDERLEWSPPYPPQMRNLVR